MKYRLLGQRDELMIATKCFDPTGSDVNARGSSRRPPATDRLEEQKK